MKLALKALFISLLSTVLIACGGGGTLSRDGDTGTSTTVTISFSVVDSNGQSVDPNSATLSATNPWTIRATVSNGSGTIAGELVTFEMPAAGFAAFSPASGTATTNNEGVASIQLQAAETAGGFSIVARTATSNDFTLNLTSAGDGNQSTVEIAKLSAFANTTQLPSSGSDEVELIVLAQNSANALIEGVEVRFTASSGQLRNATVVTGADGTARNYLTTLNEPTNREITVTVSAGGLTQVLPIQVTGTNIRINGPSSIIVGASEDVTITLVDSDGKGIGNRTVNLIVQNGTLSNTAPVTAANGQVTVKYTSSASGEDSISASALNAQNSFTINVQEDDFRFSNIAVGTPTEVPINTDFDVVTTWLKQGQPYANGQVTFTSSRGLFTPLTVTTYANGQARASIRSTSAGIAALSAQGTDNSGNVVSTSGQIEFVATTPHSVTVDATPDSIGPDGQTATITAVVRDAQGNLVKGKQVNFRVEDVSGGFVSPNSSTTDSRGIASTVFTSNAVSSNENIVITAFMAEDELVFGTTNLTVGNRAFDITLGTGNIVLTPDNASYVKEFAVFVSSSNGSPVANLNLTASVVPVKYSQGGQFRKGYWEWNPTFDRWDAIPTAYCANEDINDNGREDAGEDTNGDNSLTPGIIGTVSFANGSGNTGTTDSNGQAMLEYRYPRAFAPWTEVLISVFASSAGTESSESQKFTLVISAEDVGNEDSAPPRNPFGQSASCFDTD
ncbi:Ig-like domain-containing protein [Aliiglaciecola sp. CAU 1673]|uniref:Ig-like domain-containing protein n=1 Tax=Aliiglaciecola sp. CAU 1673 TaxID=3032595 RepID=UPI0023DCC131|nr:Ig-like domain-containing protein [Aliiglaciecola sp. CAU 1673]MDF2179968.1 Ig-like domain-containing protein [Aliiglaciecola sp. CAU 1673]